MITKEWRGLIPEILTGLTRNLSDMFVFPVYADKNIVQGLQPPCFFLAILNPEEKPLTGYRCMRRYPVDIQFYPEDPEDLSHGYQVAETLFEATRLVMLSEKVGVRGMKRSFEFADGVLIFHVSFDFILQRQPEKAVPMGGISTQLTLGEK